MPLDCAAALALCITDISSFISLYTFLYTLTMSWLYMLYIWDCSGALIFCPIFAIFWLGSSSQLIPNVFILRDIESRLKELVMLK